MAAGHRLADIKGYTRRQLLLYYKYAVQAQRGNRADHLDNLSIVFSGKPHPGSEKLRKT